MTGRSRMNRAKARTKSATSLTRPYQEGARRGGACGNLPSSEGVTESGSRFTVVGIISTCRNKGGSARQSTTRGSVILGRRQDVIARTVHVLVGAVHDGPEDRHSHD